MPGREVIVQPWILALHDLQPTQGLWAGRLPGFVGGGAIVGSSPAEVSSERVRAPSVSMSAAHGSSARRDRREGWLRWSGRGCRPGRRRWRRSWSDRPPGPGMGPGPGESRLPSLVMWMLVATMSVSWARTANRRSSGSSASAWRWARAISSVPVRSASVTGPAASVRRVPDIGRPRRRSRWPPASRDPLPGDPQLVQGGGQVGQHAQTVGVQRGQLAAETDQEDLDVFAPAGVGQLGSDVAQQPDRGVALPVTVA